MKIALIPSYEPTRVLIDILEELQKKDFEIIVVDDGSGFDYIKLFQEAACYATIIHHDTNRGKGNALKTGLTYIYDNWREGVVVTLDADGQHRVEDAQKLCEFSQDKRDVLVLGSRRLKKNVPLRSRLGNLITRFVYQLSTGMKLYDTQTGLRAFHVELVPELLNISGERYEYEMNVLLEFVRRNIAIEETEIETIYIDNNTGSHFDTLRDSYRVYKEIIKFSASSLAGFMVDYVMYSLLLLLSIDLWIANVGARVISATVNYNLNRKFVFQSNGSVVKSAMQYFVLAATILSGNTIVLELLVNICGVNQMLAKILTEVFFFSVSWLVQRCVIFQKN